MRAAFVMAAALATAPSAFASYGLATGASSPSLKVAAGNAQVSWTAGGKAQTFEIPKTGAGYYNGSFASADQSKPSSVALPMAVTVRQTSDGTYWALQQLAVTGRPTSLDVSRWHGAPTQLTLATDGKRVTGSVTYHGKPVTTTSTPAGKQAKVYVFLDCSGCPGAATGWKAMLGVTPKADGTFSVYLQPKWVGKRYRATVQGPNTGGDLAPDAQATVAAAA